MGTKSELLGKIIKGGEALTEYAQGLLKFGEEGMTQEARLQRARDMGFDTDTVYYHGTKTDISDFEPGKSEGGANFFTDNPSVASKYAGRGGAVYPVYLKNGLKESGIFPDKPISDMTDSEVNKFLDDMDSFNASLDVGREKNRYFAEQIENANDDGAGGVIIRNVKDDPVPSMTTIESDIAAITDPSNIRSVNATFDPDKKDSSNLLASIGAGVGTAGLVGAGMTPEEAQAGVLTKAVKAAQKPARTQAQDIGTQILADRTTGATGIATAPKNTLTAGIARGVNELGRRQDPVTKVALDLEELGNSYTNLGYGTAGIGDLLPVAEFLPFAAKGLGLASRAFPAVIDAIGMSSDDGLSDEAVAEFEAYKRRLLEQ